MNTKASEWAAALNEIGEGARASFAAKYEARERALKLCRDSIRSSANAIRAVHRGEFSKAQGLLDSAKGALREAEDSLSAHKDVYHAGFIADAQKEYAEAAITLAIISGQSLPTPDSLSVPYAPYLNGMGETVGELRRYLLDQLRKGKTEDCEGLLDIMGEISTVLATMDFPDSITRGLRHTSDAMRAILERTRGDVTLSVVQSTFSSRIQRLEQRLARIDEGAGRTQGQ